MKNLILLVGVLVSVCVNAQTKDVVEICAQLGETENVLPQNRSIADIFPKTIPVVVHIVHSPAIPNTFVPFEAIQPAIDQLNVDFEGTDISFTLAGYDYTNLQAYSWHDAYASGQVCFPSYQTQATILANDLAWDISEYCNIYVIPKMCSTILGYAYVGYGPDNADDGVWVLTKTFGTSAWPHLDPNHNENEVLTHEIGHYCGLFHTFHNNPGQCGGQNSSIPCEYEGDYVCDTPPTKPSSGCPGVPGFYCPISNYDGAFFNARNHMDYGGQLCRDEFTLGQIERMHSMLEYQRYELYSDDSVASFCPGDFNNDSNIGTTDLLVILSNWGCVGCGPELGDATLDYVVGTNDLNWVLANWGETCGDEIGMMEILPISFEKILRVEDVENAVLKFYDLSGREISNIQNYTGIVITVIYFQGTMVTLKTFKLDI